MNKNFGKSENSGILGIDVPEHPANGVPAGIKSEVGPLPPITKNPEGH